MKVFSSMLVPVFLCIIGIIMLVSKKDMMVEFSVGAREGMKTCADLLPNFILLVCAINMFNASGAADLIAKVLDPVLNSVGIPSELSPLLVVRPISGGASNAVIESILSEEGADSFVGRCASVIAGSSDTIIYITALYFSSVGIKKTGYALPVAFITMIFCTVFSCLLCRIFFGS